MPEPTTHKNIVSAEEVLRTEIILNQALIDILIAKQVITEAELVQSIDNIKRDRQKLLNDSAKIISIKR